MLNFKNILVLPIYVFRWMSHRNYSIYFILLHFQTTARGPGDTLTPVTNSHEVLRDKVFSLQSCSVTGRLHNYMMCSQLLVNHGGTTPLFSGYLSKLA